MYAICRRDPKGLDECGDQLRHPGPLHGLSTSCSRTPTSTPSTSTRRSRITPGCRSRRCRPASTSPAPCRWARRIDECRQIVEAQRASGKVYMMMETVVYSREYLFVKELYDKGELGRIQFLRGSHQQDMDGWPDYWPGLPPMWYATHCVSPCLAIAGQACRERGLPRLGPDSRGADRASTAARSPSRRPRSRSRTRDVVAEVTRSLFDTARQYRESFDAYGQQEELRVAAGRGRGAGHPHQEHGRAPACRARDPQACQGSRLRAPAARADPAVHDQGGLRSRTPSICRSSREAATAARTRTWSTPS